MAEHNQEHIDQLFRQQFDEVEVRFNPSHWSAMQQTLAAAAAGAAVAASESAWHRLLRLMKSNLNVWIAVISSMGLCLGIFLMFRKSGAVEFLPIRKESDLPQVELQSMDSDTITPYHSVKRDSISLVNAPVAGGSDTIQKSNLLPVDTIQVVTVDTTKALKDFIFW